MSLVAAAEHFLNYDANAHAIAYIMLKHIAGAVIFWNYG